MSEAVRLTVTEKMADMQIVDSFLCLCTNRDATDNTSHACPNGGDVNRSCWFMFVRIVPGGQHVNINKINALFSCAAFIWCENIKQDLQ